MAGTSAGGVPSLDKLLGLVLSPLREAVTYLTVGMNQLGQAMAPFVGALSPGAMQQFSESLTNLNATIGQALLPVIEVFTDAIRQMSGVIGPLMRELAPVFTALAQVMAGLLLPIVGLVASVLGGLVPLFQLLADFVLMVADGLKIFYAVMTVVVNLFKAVLAPIFNVFATVLHGLMDVIKTVIAQIVLLGAAIAKAVGINIQPFIDALKPKKAEINAAPQNAAIKSFDQIRQDITNAAFVAGGTSGKKTQDEWSEELVSKLQAIQDQNKSIGQVFNEGLDAIKTSIETNWDKICTAFREVPDKVKQALGL